MGVKNDLIDITDEKINGIIYKTFDTPASLFFAKTPVHSAEHEGLYRIFADLIFADAMLYRENRESFRAYGTPFIQTTALSISGIECRNSALLEVV